MVARTLNEAGIDMGCDCTGEYPQCKYEDPRVLKIKNDILYDGQITPSYELPTSYHDQRDQIIKYVKIRQVEPSESWGFKVPDITLCYPMWKPYLPEHRVIGIRRTLAGVVAHYAMRREPPDAKVIERAWRVYNHCLGTCSIPTVRFEDIIENGIEPIEDIVGMRLPDVRRSYGTP